MVIHGSKLCAHRDASFLFPQPLGPIPYSSPANVPLYVTALATASKSSLVENRGILGCSIMLFVDWLIRRLLLKGEF